MGATALVREALARIGRRGRGAVAAPSVVDGDTLVVRVADLRKAYRGRTAVDGIGLEVRRGEIHGLIGADGAGKSSLLKAVAGVLAFDAGEVEVFGTRIDSEASAERVKGRIGFMPQGLGLNLYPELSVEENVDFFARLRLVPEEALAPRKARLLAATRLERFRDRPMKNLSGGMKQKLGLVCTLVHEPELVILDEPTTGVDPVSRRDFWGILDSLLRERGVTALVSTAYMDEASRFHRVCLLHGGRVLAQGEPREIAKRVPGSVVEVRTDAQLEALGRLKVLFPDAEAIGSELRTFVEGCGPEDAERAVADALHGLAVDGLHVGPAELEDVFLALLRRGTADVPFRTHPVRRRASAPRDEEAAIEAVALVRDFGTFRAVDRASFRVRRGEIFGLLGANGAGKTTVIKMLTGIVPPSGGGGRVAGVDIRATGESVKERIGYLSQAFSLYRDLTVLENLRLYAGIYGLSPSESRQRIEAVLDVSSLGSLRHERALALPIGIRQRLALGCALVHRPQILFLDEPTSGVDPAGRRRLWDILFELSHGEGVTILVTTHYLTEAEHCDHLALMHAGRIVADDSPAGMKRETEAEAGRILEVATPRPLDALSVLEREAFPGATLLGTRIRLLARDPERAGTEVREALEREGIPILSLTERPLAMEDVFVHRIRSLEREVA